jgi:hypothetical protein
MNTRRRAHRVKGQAKPLMIIPAELWSILIFIRGNARAESNRSCMERRSGAPYFLYAAMCALKIIEAERYIDQ